MWLGFPTILERPKWMDNKLLFVIDRVTYRWSGWFGCQLESREWRRHPAGKERIILGDRYRVWSTKRDGLAYCTYWSLCELPNDINEANAVLRALREKLVRELW